MSTLAIYPRHDANVSISNGQEVMYFELEKFVQKRYFAFSENIELFNNQLASYLMNRIEPESIDHLVCNWIDVLRLNVIKQLLPNVNKVTFLRHHLSHAWSAYMFTAPTSNDLIASIDGGGDENDYFRIYSYSGDKIHELANIPINLGKPYRLIGLLSPELYRDQSTGYRMDLALSGKKMSLAALGKMRPEFVNAVKSFYLNFMEYYDPLTDSADINFSKLLQGLGFSGQMFLDRDTARDVLATSQYVFEEIIKEYLYPHIKSGLYSRVVMVGGCGLNVTMNSKIVKECNIEVFVPPCPNDCGISLGAIKQVYPNIPLIKHPFSHNLPDDAHELKIARREFYTSNVTINEIAQVLANGKIIGTIVGPLEIGPRALGNRSYLASPLIPGMKNRINSQQIKDREVWRPVAPILTIESMAHYFDNVLPSPYMTFAPAVKSEFRKLLGEIMHIDCSARIQTVTSSDGWIYWLLKEFGKITSHEILMNTSFNTKGNPLINSYGDAFKLLKTSSLDAVLVGSSSDKFELFSKAERISYE